MSESFHPGKKTWFIAFLASFWAYRRTRNLAVDLFFKVLRRSLLMLPHYRRSQIVKYILGRPTLSGRKLMHRTTLPHGSQWDHITPLQRSAMNKTGVAGHWYRHNIYHHQEPHRYMETTLHHQDLVLLYIHGGGFRVGTSTMYSDFFLQILNRLKKQHDIRASMLSLEYGLAPEVNLHYMLEQAGNAYRYLLNLGVPPAKIIVGGDSAGGHLTASLFSQLRDQQVPLPLGGILISPFVCFEKTSPSFIKFGDFDCLPTNMLEQDLTEVLPALKTLTSDDDKVKHLQQHSPLYVDSTGFPSLLVTYGQRERFANDVESYITRLTKQGVDVSVLSRHQEPHVYICTPLLSSTIRAWITDVNQLADWCSQRVKHI